MTTVLVILYKDIILFTQKKNCTDIFKMYTCVLIITDQLLYSIGFYYLIIAQKRKDNMILGCYIHTATETYMYYNTV